MPKTLSVPMYLQKSFSRLIDLIPAPFRFEEQVQKEILLFLKLEGEEFVRNRIDQSIEVFSERSEDNFVELVTEK